MQSFSTTCLVLLCSSLLSSIPQVDMQQPSGERIKVKQKPSLDTGTGRKTIDDNDSDDSDDDKGEPKETRIAHYNRLVQMWKERVRKTRPPGGVIRFKTSFTNTIYDAFKKLGWKETKSETEWDVMWTERSWIRGVYDRVHLDAHQKVNHYRNFYELCRKDNLIKNLKRQRRRLITEGLLEQAAQYNFFPETFALPAEYLLFVEAFKANPGYPWIMKPVGSCQGKGVFLFDKLNQISEWRNDYRWKPDSNQADKYVVQQYINNPLLVGGKKFDLRLYILVSSYAPLTIWLYRDGFCRFSTERFTAASAANMDKSYMHLTNVAVQKKSNNYNADSGMKWLLRDFRVYMTAKVGEKRVNELFVEIQNMIINSLLSVATIIINDKNSFEMYGYDVLIDDLLKVWLIEVNASPSLTANTQADHDLKVQLLVDTLTVVDVEGKLNPLAPPETQVGGYDLIYYGSNMLRGDHCAMQSYLGCRDSQQY